MSPTILALLLYAAWTLLLVAGIAGQRALLVLRGRPANSFTTTGDDVSPFSARLCRAHGNCVENLPVFGGVVLAAALTDKLAITDPLALVLLGARLGQSLTHLISTSHIAVSVRFAFFAAQVGILVYWVAALLLA